MTNPLTPGPEADAKENRAMVGEYRMLNGTLVRIAEEVAPGRYRATFVSVNKNDVFSGGGAFPIPEGEFRQITKPVLRAAARVFEARRLSEEHRQNMAKQKAEEHKWQGVLATLRECREGVA